MSAPDDNERATLEYAASQLDELRSVLESAQSITATTLVYLRLRLSRDDSADGSADDI